MYIAEIYIDLAVKGDYIAKACYAEQAYLTDGKCQNVPCECEYLNNGFCFILAEALSIQKENLK